MATLVHRAMMTSIVKVGNPTAISSMGEVLDLKWNSNSSRRLVHVNSIAKPGHSKMSANSSNVAKVSQMNNIVKTAETDETVHMNRLCELYSKFLADMAWSNTVELNEYDRLEEVYARLLELVPMSSVPFKTIRAGVGFGYQISRGRTVDEMAKVGHSSALILAIDDLCGKGEERYIEDMSLFHMRLTNPEAYKKLYPHRGPLHPVLEELITHLRTELSVHFPHQPRHQATLIANFLNFVEGCLLEHTNEKHELEYNTAMQFFPIFSRWKTGVAEMCLNQVFSGPEMVPGNYSSDTALSDEAFYYTKINPLLPELCFVFCTANDIMSFYKEFRDGETGSSISNLAKVKQISSLDAFEEVVAATIECTKRVRIMAERSNSLIVQNTVEKFLQNYINWHISLDSRYSLSEVFGNEWYQGAKLL